MPDIDILIQQMRTNALYVSNKTKGEEVRSAITDSIRSAADAIEEAVNNQLVEVDDTLTLEGYGADAATVGEEFTELSNDITQYNATDLIPFVKTERTNNGVTYAPANNKYVVDGTATSLSTFALWSSADGLPPGVEPGGKYYLLMSSDKSINEKKVSVQIYCYKTGEDVELMFTTNKNQIVNIPKNAYAIAVRLRVAANTTVDNETVHVALLNTLSNSMITSGLEEIQDNLIEKAILLNLENTGKTFVHVDIAPVYINNDGEYIEGESYIIPRTEFEKIKATKLMVKGSPNYNALISFLKTLNFNSDPDFCSGESGRRSLSYTRYTSLSIPFDCNYIVINKKASSNPTQIFTPEEILLIGFAPLVEQAENQKHFIYGNLGSKPGWYLIDGSISESSGLDSGRSSPIPVESWQTIYFCGTNDSYVCNGAWLDSNLNWLSPLGVISPWRVDNTSQNPGTKIGYDQDAVIVKNGLYYRCKSRITSGSTWDDVWDENPNISRLELLDSKPVGYMELYEYDIPEKGAVPARRYTDDTAADEGPGNHPMIYYPMWKILPPNGAAYLVINKRSASTIFRNIQGVSTEPIFVLTGTPNSEWHDNDLWHNKKIDKKLCIIGQSGTVVGRSLRNMADYDFSSVNDDTYKTLDPVHSQPLVGFQEYLIPFYEEIKSYGFSGENYMKKDEHSIYDEIITGHADLSNYDEFLLGLGGNDITSISVIGDDDNETDRNDPTKFVGGLNAVIDYIFDQTKASPQTHFIPPRIYMETLPVYIEENLDKINFMNEQARKICKRRGIVLIDRAAESGINKETANRQYYDGVHNNNYGMMIRGQILRNALIGF